MIIRAVIGSSLGRIRHRIESRSSSKCFIFPAYYTTNIFKSILQTPDLALASSAITTENDDKEEAEKNAKPKNDYGCLYLASPKLDPLVKAAIAKTDPRLVATKIGFVHEGMEAVNNRIKQLQTGNPIDLKVDAFPCTRAPLAEKFWHDYFKKKGKHVNREWYDLDEEDITFIAEEMREYNKSGNLLGSSTILDAFEPKRLGYIVKEEEHKDEAVGSINTFLQVKSVLKRHMGLLTNDNIHSESSHLIDKDELNLLLGVLEKHPKSKEKIGCGVKSIFVAEHQGYESYCFHVKRIDNSEEDFSYLKCFGDKERRGDGYDAHYFSGSKHQPLNQRSNTKRSVEEEDEQEQDASFEAWSSAKKFSNDDRSDDLESDCSYTVERLRHACIGDRYDFTGIEEKQKDIRRSNEERQCEGDEYWYY